MVAATAVTPGVVTAHITDVRFLLEMGVEFTFRSLVARLQQDFGISFREADSLIWSGAGSDWTISQTTGRIMLLRT